MRDICIVWTTVDREEHAVQLAEILVRRRAAACVSVVPGVRSVYPWQGQLCRETEWLLMIKTRMDQLERLRTIFTQYHPYTVPEFLVLRMDEVGTSYAEWLHDWIDGRSQINDAVP